MKYLLLLLLLPISFSIAAQSSNQGTHADTSAPGFVQKMQQRGHNEALRSIEIYQRGKISVHQRQILERVKKLNQEIKIFLKSGIDTNGIQLQLKRTQSALEIVKDGIFTHKGSYQTQRNLVVSSAIVTELSERLEKEKSVLDAYATQLVQFRVQSDSLQGDSAVYSFSADSLQIVNYLKRLVVIVKEIAPVDTSLNKTLANVEALQVKLDLTVFELRSLKEDLEIYSSQLAGANGKKEFPYLWEDPVSSRPLHEIIRFSIAKESIILRYYIEENIGTLLILIIALCSSWMFLRSLKQQLRKNGSLHADFSEQLVVRYPLLAATLLALNIFQFIFSDPPFIFYLIIWLISAICLLFIFHRYITAYWMKFWVITVIFFVLAGLDNLILQTSRAERLFTLFLSAAGIAYTAFILLNRHRQELREKNIPWFIAFVLVCQLAAFWLNLFGRFNLSKAFLISGYAGVVIAIIFLWVVRGLNNGLRLVSTIYKHPTRRLFFINFDRVGKEVPPIFYVVLVAGWFYLIGKNFYVLKKFYDVILSVITRQRMVGDYKFSIWGMLVFLLILVCSTFISKLVSFFSAEPVGNIHVETDKNRFKLGSYLLLVRIFIISVGVFFAFAAAGISLDKITIILGALSVGIGLGLQGLVTNLVSGLILSFERPVNVGDLIELNGKPGTMKSIGFRSSIIASADGSCIIIPNGELLNQHMVNWTMGHNLKRNSFILPVAFDSNLEKVKELLMNVLQKDTRILSNPAPNVFIKDVGQNGFMVEVVFWPTHLSIATEVKSDLFAGIDASFKKENITIPLPQQDVHVYNQPDVSKQSPPFQ